ncbi:hypothetical protein GFY24_10715 [Nocardia sp. SYP-A9097]|uniref:hypothetical protein n=1 Tax=Nocardia sp. SYP-A9097 TaxID=2663237 RepID=UPI00129A4756|nr:hypothetical protein [Nocardia sp. SYP-A9097]MRH87911.1 hypothetical protein [Nocardia sp. SYP-A9097]
MTLTAGKFTLNAVTGQVQVLDETGRVLEALAPTATVDGAERNLKLAIGSGGSTLTATLDGGITPGAHFVAPVSKELEQVVID